MTCEDRVLLNLLYRFLRECEPFDEGGTLRLGFRTQPDEQVRKVLDRANILLKIDSLGDNHWVTAELDDATVMLPLGRAGRMVPRAPAAALPATVS